MMLITAITGVALCAVCYAQTTQSRIIGTIPGLPPGSMEIKPHENITTPVPYRIPQPGDGLYDATRESEIKEHRSNTVRLYERGVFVGYSQINGVKPASENNAVDFDATFKVNPNLPADAVELPPNVQEKPGEFYHTQPATRPANIPNDFMLTRVFQGTNFIGWCYLSKKLVADMHKSKAATKRSSK